MDLDKATIKAFCEHCDWAHQCWLMRKHLYDKNPKEELLKHPHHAYFFIRLEKILQEYWLTEVVKLHDPKSQGGHSNLSVPLILDNPAWPAKLDAQLREISKNMNGFVSYIRPARNKLLSHKDKNTILSSRTLGSFDQGADESYFKNLAEFANLAHQYVVGEPFLFDDLTKNDVEIFMGTFENGLA